MHTYCPVCRNSLTPNTGEPDQCARTVSIAPVPENRREWDQATGAALYEALEGWESCERRLGAAREEIEKWKRWYHEVKQYIPGEIGPDLEAKAPDSEPFLKYLDQAEHLLGLWLLKKQLWIW